MWPPKCTLLSLCNIRTCADVLTGSLWSVWGETLSPLLQYLVSFLKRKPRFVNFSRSHRGWRDVDSLYSWAFKYLPSLVTQLNYQAFMDNVVDSEDPWIIDFYAPWCGHCIQFAPHYEKVAKVSTFENDCISSEIYILKFLQLLGLSDDCFGVLVFWESLHFAHHYDPASTPLPSLFPQKVCWLSFM